MRLVGRGRGRGPDLSGSAPQCVAPTLLQGGTSPGRRSAEPLTPRCWRQTLATAAHRTDTSKFGCG